MPHEERKFAEMHAMGFTDDIMIDCALTRARGNVESAVEMLFEGVIPLSGTDSAEMDSGPVVRLLNARAHCAPKPGSQAREPGATPCRLNF